MDWQTGELVSLRPGDHWNPAATDISFHGEHAAEVTGSWSTNGTTVDQNTATLYQVRDNAAVGSTNRHFMRLHITRP